MDVVREWIARNKKLFVLLVVLLCVIIAGSAVRCTFVQGEKQEQAEEAQSKDVHCELTSAQKAIYSEYDKNTQDIIDFLKNSKWVDNSGNKALFMYDSDFVERANEKETSESYVICAVETNKEKISSIHSQTTYRLTTLNSSGEYQNATLKKVTDGDNTSAALLSACIESEDLFNNATIYNRVNNTDSFRIENWDDNANQFIQDKYGELYNCIKDYCSKYYPQVSFVSWSSLVTIDYSSHLISYSFNVKTSSTYTLEVSYSQDTGLFECYKAKTT